MPEMWLWRINKYRFIHSKPRQFQHNGYKKMKPMQSNQLYHCLLGGAVGDALGLPFEGLSAKRTQKLFHNHQAYNLVPFIKGGMVSDDTEHAVMTVQAFIKAQGNQDKFRKNLRMRLRLWLLSLPAGIGLATGRALFKLWAFVPNSGVFSAGNGGAMRAAVLGVMVEDLANLREFVTISTTITHTDPKAVEGAMVVALSTWFNVHRRNNINGDVITHSSQTSVEWSQTLLTFLQEHIHDDELKSYLQKVFIASQTEQSLTEAMHDLFGKKAMKNGITGYMYHTIPAVMFAYFKYPHQPLKGLQCLIKAGGDVDTTCAIAGGIWGVNHGQAIFDNIEGKWLEPKITPMFLKQLAEQSDSTTPKTLRFGGITTLIRNLIFLLIVLAHGFRRLLPPY